MVRVYRVENEKGEGPYQADPRPSWDAYAVPWDHTPAPSDDFPWLRDLRQCGVYHEVLAPLHFGFPSREAAEQWFSKEGLEDLAEQGFHLKEFDVPAAVIAPSGKQCMFRRDHAYRFVRVERTGFAPEPLAWSRRTYRFTMEGVPDAAAEAAP